MTRLFPVKSSAPMNTIRRTAIANTIPPSSLPHAGSEPWNDIADYVGEDHGNDDKKACHDRSGESIFQAVLSAASPCLPLPLKIFVRHHKAYELLLSYVPHAAGDISPSLLCPGDGHYSRDSFVERSPGFALSTLAIISFPGENSQ